MNTEIALACQCFGLYDDKDNIVGFIGVLHQPHGRNAKIKRVSRLVILPDYQGIGLGYKFLNIVAEYYRQEGFDFSIVTSAKNLIVKLNSKDDWNMIRLGRNNCASDKSAIDCNRPSIRKYNTTASFFYKRMHAGATRIGSGEFSVESR